MKSKPEETFSEAALRVIGWLAIIGGVISGLVSVSNSNSDAGIGAGLGLAFGAIVVAMVLFPFATVIRKLCEIEYHLKGPQPPIEAETSEEEKPNTDSDSAG
jgi:hypothetical protein